MNILVVSESEGEVLFKGGFEEQYNVNYVADAKPAMDFIENNPLLDILVIDMDLPGKSALDLITQVRNSDCGEDLLISIITSPTNAAAEVEGLKLGADEYIRRPITKETFKAAFKLYEKFAFQRSEKNQFKELAMIYDALFQQAPIGISLSHSDKPLKGQPQEHFEVNKNYMKITGRTKKELQETGWSAITHPDDREREIFLYEQMQQGVTNGYEMEKRYIKPDGSIVWVYLISTAIEVDSYNENSHVCIIQDITERKEAEIALSKSERSNEILISNLPGLAFRCKNDETWTMKALSGKSKEILGYLPEEVIDNAEVSYNDIILPEYREEVKAQWKESVRGHKPLETSYKIKAKDGQIKWIHEASEGVVEEDGRIEYIEGMLFDDTERRRIEDNLKFITEHQVWTGIHNRRYLDKFYSEKRINGGEDALILINMSKLSTLNMSYGYGYYRDIIKNIGTTLTSFANQNRHLFHVSENLFLIYVEKYEGKTELVEFGQNIAHALESLLALEIAGGGIGIVEIQDDSFDDLDRVMGNALIASEEANAECEGRIPCSFFDEEMERQLLRKELIKQELAKVSAGGNGEKLFLEFQPIINLKDNDRIWSFEALARFNSETLGRLSPIEFIPIAEETKLIIPLGEMIIEKAFDFQKQMEEEGHPDIRLNINLSAIQMREEGFLDKILESAERKKISLDRVSFEITESTLMENYGELNHLLEGLVDKGASIAIDDFGTGYSSLARERELNVSYMKIDKYFLDKIMTLKSFDDSIVGDIISMAHKLDNYAVAEGVEHLSQMEFLKMKGCDGAQGYFISRPLSAKAAIKFIKDYGANG